MKFFVDKKIKIAVSLDNEILFVGSKDIVTSYFQKKGMEIEVLPIREQNSIYQVKHSDQLSYENIESDLKERLVAIEPNYIYEPSFEVQPKKWPKDKFFFNQWYLNNVGQSAPYGLPGKRGADLDFMKLRTENIRGSEEIVVAVVDTGIDYTHPDLKDNMWINKTEVEGVDGIDDDKNGYTDDKYGFDFYSQDTTKLWYGKPGDSDPRDENGHGTHCAGVIGAKGDNDIGIVGLNQHVKLMAVKIFGANGGASSADIQRAIYYASDQNVNIMSNSWGGGPPSELVRQAIEEAGKKGIVFVAAAGNDGVNNDVEPSFPSGYTTRKDNLQRLSNVISVGASDNQDNPATFTNYGYTSVDVFAPGVQIMSTYPTDLTNGDDQPYRVLSGTSMATPLVSGVVALMMASHPELKSQPEKIRDVLIETSDTSPALVGKSISNGRINAHKAVKYLSDKSLNLSQWETKPYSMNGRGFNQELVDIRHRIEVKGAKAISAHFNFVQILEPFDSIYFYDKNLRFISALEKTESMDVWSPVVPGDTLHLRFVNAKLKTVKTVFDLETLNDNACESKGGILETHNKVSGCKMDSSDSSESGSEIFNSFYSEGFSIDQIKYAM